MKGEGVSLSLFLVFAVPNSSDHLDSLDMLSHLVIQNPYQNWPWSCSFCKNAIVNLFLPFLLLQYMFDISVFLTAILKKYKSVIKSFADYFFSKLVWFCVTIGRFLCSLTWQHWLNQWHELRAGPPVWPTNGRQTGFIKTEFIIFVIPFAVIQSPLTNFRAETVDTNSNYWKTEH